MKKITRVIKGPHEVELLNKYLLKHFEEQKWPIRFVMQKYSKGRSIDQNSLLHMWFAEIAEQTFDSPASVKADLKAMYLPEVFNEKLNVTRVKNTSDLNVQEMSDFLQQIEVLAVNFQWILTRPGADG